LEGLGVTTRFGDLTRPAMLESICDGIDTVYHLAGRVTYWGRKKDFYDAIYAGTKNLLEAAAGKVSRFVYVSSFCACGLGRHLKGITEDDPARKTGIYYGDAKLDAENLVWQYQHEHNLPATVVRPSNVIGPGSVWVRDAVDSYLHSRIFHLIDHGQHSASLISVQNLVDGLILAGTAEIARGKTYFFRDEWDVTWERYFCDIGALLGKPLPSSMPFGLAWGLALVNEKFAELFHVKTLLTRHMIGMIGRDLDVDVTRAKNELGWRTRVTYEEEMARIAEWVKQIYGLDGKDK